MFQFVISLNFYLPCERFQWYEILSFNYIFYTHMYIEKTWENPVQIKSNIYYVRIRERKRQRLSLSLLTVEPHFLLEMDT